MLRELLEEVASRPNQAPGPLWTYRFSGNTLELLVTPDYALDPEKYRLGVVETGRVLQAIESNLSGTGRVMQTQSFPSLGESRLAALVRLQKIYGAGVLNGKLKTTDEISLSERFRTLAAQFGLSFQSLPAVKSPTSAGTHSKASDEPVSNGFLCSAIDNPFIWLKVGKWIEAIQLMAANSEVEIDLAIQLEDRARIAKDTRYCNYVQAVIHLK